MKRFSPVYMTLSALLASALFQGCGGTSSADGAKAHDTSALKHMRSLDAKDWTWYVDFTAESISPLNLHAAFYKKMPSGIEHLQYFLDTDDNVSTGYTGKNGWEVYGADYLIEDGRVYRYAGEGAWRWSYLGRFKSYSKEDVSDGNFIDIEMADPEASIEAIFGDAGRVNLSIEAYDANWTGNYPTITDLSLTLNQNGGEIDTERVEGAIRDRYSESNRTYATTIRFSPDKSTALALVRDRFGMHLIRFNTQNLDDNARIAEDYKSRFLIETLNIIDNDQVEFVEKEQNLTQYRVTYNYKTDSEISKVLVDAAENVRKVLVQIDKDSGNDGSIDARTTFGYNSHGDKVSEKSDINGDGLFERDITYAYTYDDDGNITQKTTTFKNGTVVTETFDAHHNITQKILKTKSKTFTWRYTYTYDANGAIMTKTTSDLQQNSQTVHTYHYDAQNRLVRITVGETLYKAFTYQDGNLVKEEEFDPVDHSATTKAYSYNDAGKKIRETYSVAGSMEYTKQFVYNDDGKILHETTTHEDGTVDKRYYLYEYVALGK